MGFMISSGRGLLICEEKVPVWVATWTKYVSQHELLVGEAWLASREKCRT